MKKGIYLVALSVLLVALLLGACSKPAPSPTPTTAPPKATQAVPSATAPPKTTAPAASTTAAPKPAATAPAGQVYNLKISGHYAVGIASEKRHIGYFIERLKALAGNRLKIDYYPADQLVKIENVLDAVQTGIVDIIDTIPTFYEATIPMVGAANLPFLWSSCTAKERQTLQSELFWATPAAQKAYAKYNARILFSWAGSDTTFFMKKQINKMDDMKGLRIRAAGSLHSGVIKAAGGVPHVLAPTEVYLALQTGVLDGALIPMTSLFDRKLYEVTKHVIADVASSSAGGPILMRNETFNKLPKDLQDIVLQAAKESDKYNLEAGISENEKMYADAKNVGMIFTALPKADINKWQENCKEVFDEWLKKAGPEGQEMLNFLKKEIAAKCSGTAK